MNPTRVLDALRPINQAMFWSLLTSLALTTTGLATTTSWLITLGCLGILTTGPAGVLTMLTMLTAQLLADALAIEAAEVAATTPNGPVETVADGSGSPATGSGPATATNRRILRK